MTQHKSPTKIGPATFGYARLGMPYIQNVSLADIQKGLHIDPGPNWLLIQIVDPDRDWPKPKYVPTQSMRYKFLDVEDTDLVADQNYRIQRCQAEEIVSALQEALQHGRNVLVHCHAGICRSGAVAEVGVMMGFQDTGTYRQPNLRVKRMLMEQLGWTYSNADTEPQSGEDVIKSLDN